MILESKRTGLQRRVTAAQWDAIQGRGHGDKWLVLNNEPTATPLVKPFPLADKARKAKREVENPVEQPAVETTSAQPAQSEI